MHRRRCLLVAVALLAILSATAPAVVFNLAQPDGPLSDTEKKFLGKWRGQAINLQWEIERRQDRSFELAFHERDAEDGGATYRNYAKGRWWASEDTYYFEWTQWWGDEGDFSGVVAEPIATLGRERIVTLSEGVESPENIEVRVDQFQLAGWELKP